LVALGFPDIIIEPSDIYKKLVASAKKTDYDIVLGLFPVEKYNKWDMIELDATHHIKSIVIKENRTDLTYGWSVAVWKPSFTQFLHEYLIQILTKNTDGKIHTSKGLRELYIGDVFLAAKAQGLKITYEIFEEGYCIDIGTPEDLNFMLNKNTKLT
jgi:glucose-1-phosphate thymidylyltransferase